MKLIMICDIDGESLSFLMIVMFMFGVMNLVLVVNISSLILVVWYGRLVRVCLFMFIVSGIVCL